MKNVFPCRLLRLVSGNSFFQAAAFLCFTRVAAAIHSSMDTVFFRTALAVITCVYTTYLTRI